MAVIGIDTYALIKRLQETGFSEEQAKALSDTFQSTQDKYLESIATKRDLEGVELVLRRDMKDMENRIRQDMKESETGLRHEMKELEANLKAAMSEFKADIIKTLVYAMVAVTAIFSAIVKLF